MGKWLLAGGAGLTVAYFALSPEGPIDEWVSVGPVGDLPTGEIQHRLVTVTARGKWMDLHKDYNINWRPDLGTFVCPGHKSAFDPTGKVLSGPSPRPMDTLEYKVENGVLWVRFQKFKRSIPAKELFT